jgi:activator of HSP90 ATPase
MPRNVILAASLPATAERLFNMYLDPRAHAAFTGAPVTIEPYSGTPFRTFDGMLTGTMLHVEPKRLIVQTWRSANWPSEVMDAVLTLSFWPEGDAARIKLVHGNVPDEDFAGVSQGLEKYYWSPCRDHVSE